MNVSLTLLNKLNKEPIVHVCAEDFHESTNSEVVSFILTNSAETQILEFTGPIEELIKFFTAAAYELMSKIKEER